MKKVVVIMAGGKGKRLWPISKEELPKQFLPLVKKDTMLELTVKRAMKIVDAKDIYIVTQPEYIEITKSQIKNVPSHNILAEFNLKSTTEAIAYATAIIQKKYGDAITIVFPSDHAIKEENKLISAIEEAEQLANNNHIVTLGIIPEYPEVNYGYIEKSDIQEKKNIYKVKQFKEKPEYKVAKKYFEDKKHLWNSGIYIWKNTFIYQEFAKYLPDIYLKMNELLQDNTNKNKDDKKFVSIKTKSIDYEILEKTSDIYVVQVNFKWTDIGTYKTLKKLKKKDKYNNTIEGNVIVQNSKNNIILSKEKQIVALGLENLVIVETEKEILVMNAENQDVCVNDILTETINK